MIRPGERASYLGPVVTNSTSEGEELLHKLLGLLPGSEPVFWDIPEANASARSIAEDLGFRKQRPLIRMGTGTGSIQDRPEWQWAIGGPATG